MTETSGDFIPREKVEALAKSFDRMIGCKIACDGVLLTDVGHYNKTVALFNEILGLTPEKSNEDK